jgi:hypothetical protein
MIAALLLAVQAPLPAPSENGLQPPMTFACQLNTGAKPVVLTGKMYRFYAKMAPGTGLFVTPQNGDYLDHIIIELAPSQLQGLAGRYDTNAHYPVDTDRMVVTLPGQAERPGFTLSFSSVRFGVGYQAFNQVRVERSDGSAPLAGSCTTVLPKIEKKS